MGPQGYSEAWPNMSHSFRSLATAFVIGPPAAGRRGSCPDRGCRRSSNRGFEIVFDAAIADRLAVEQDITGPPVAVARLADRADVAQRLAAVEPVGVGSRRRGSGTAGSR